MRAWIFTILLFIPLAAKTWQVPIQNTSSAAILSPLLSASPSDTLVLTGTFGGALWQGTASYSLDAGNIWSFFTAVYYGSSNANYFIADSLVNKHICFRISGIDGHCTCNSGTYYSNYVSIVSSSTSILMRAPQLHFPPLFFVDLLGRVAPKTGRGGWGGANNWPHIQFPLTP